MEVLAAREVLPGPRAFMHHLLLDDSIFDGNPMKTFSLFTFGSALVLASQSLAAQDPARHDHAPGAHTSQPYHNAVFLDGHAAPVYVTQHDVNSWGGRIPGRYIPKYGEGWREARNPYPQGAGAPDQKGVPWSGAEPMGIGPRSSQVAG